ncbi:unnamed protein product [Sphenostylis stenocarpa]|uniref:AIG1-type G domain-containing protein n=1 Tax=Sphenostylis stenocarpa TaxID=92480 RepID=A0AA86VMM6_9FABA|nr:unnamed protein product [Sphenostylis stenocarpa]
MMGKASSSDAMTLVLVGKTGNGKSALGNSILGRTIFKSKRSSSGVTRICELQRTIIKDGPIVNVIDTPGLYDGTHSAGKEIVKCIDMAKEGIHAVLMVYSIKNRFSEEEYATFLALQALFGHKIVDYMIVVFTGGDELEENEETLEDYIGHDCPQPLKDILALCGNRKVLFDNKTKEKEKKLGQVQELLKLVDMVISYNDGKPFTNELFMELKEKAKMRDTHQKAVESLQGYSKAEMAGIKMHMQQQYDDDLKRMTNMVESKLREETTNLLKKLEEERVARLKAEEDYKLIQIQSCSEIERLKQRVESKLREETANLLKKLEEERVCRVKAEENYELIQIQSNSEIERLKRQVEEANGRRNPRLPFPFNILVPFVRPIPPPCPIL